MTDKSQPRTTKEVTAQIWKRIEAKLTSFYCQVELICDGYEITLQLQRTGQFTNAICIYVNGTIEGKWFLGDCEESRRFYQRRTKSITSKKDMNDLKKISKEYYKERLSRNQHVYYEPYWTSFRLLKSHLTKNNQLIEWICDGEGGE